jgi:hypothetical protein
VSGPTEHKIVEAMGASWDEQGHRPPYNWHVECSCGWTMRGLRDQMAMFDAWKAHVQFETGQGAGL